MRDDIDYLNDEEGHDFLTLGKDLFSKIPLKKAALLALVMVLVLSTTFISTVLSKISGAVVLENTTTKGSLIQVLVVVLAYIGIDIIINAELI